MSVRRTQVVVALLALVGFAAVVQQVFANGPLVDLDHALADRYSDPRLVHARSIQRVARRDVIETIGRALSSMGDVRLLLLATAVTAVVLYRRGRRRDAQFLTIALVGGVVLNLVVRLVIGHYRPDFAYPYYFISRFGLPSGHALDATSFYGALVFIAWARLSPAWRLVGATSTTVLVAAIAYSRVVVLAHYFSDVLAGVTLGVAWLFLVAVAFSLPERDRLPATA